MSRSTPQPTNEVCRPNSREGKKCPRLGARDLAVGEGCVDLRVGTRVVSGLDKAGMQSPRCADLKELLEVTEDYFF
jgi:hypothetical protein